MTKTLNANLVCLATEEQAKQVAKYMTVNSMRWAPFWVGIRSGTEGLVFDSGEPLSWAGQFITDYARQGLREGGSVSVSAAVLEAENTWLVMPPDKSGELSSRCFSVIEWAR